MGAASYETLRLTDKLEQPQRQMQQMLAQQHQTQQLLNTYPQRGGMHYNRQAQGKQEKPEQKQLEEQARQA